MIETMELTIHELTGGTKIVYSSISNGSIWFTCENTVTNLKWLLTLAGTKVYWTLRYEDPHRLPSDTLQRNHTKGSGKLIIYKMAPGENYITCHINIIGTFE